MTDLEAARASVIDYANRLTEKELDETNRFIMNLLTNKSLDERMKEAGMIPLSEIKKNIPMEAIKRHAGVHNMDTFEKWLIMRYEECTEMHARFDLEKRHDDEMYEWVLAHSAAFSEVLANFRAAKEKK